MSGIAGSRILVTGGAGFIGSHLVDALVDGNARSVTVLDNLVNGSEQNLAAALGSGQVTLHRGDVRDPRDVASAVADIDIVFHLACLGVRHSLHSPFENHEVNALGTLNLLEESRKAQVSHFVYTSTSEVFGTAQYVPMDETHPTWPETVYGGSKLAGEAYTRAYFRTYGFPTVVVRPFNTFGPRSHFGGDSGEVLPRTAVRMLCGEPAIVFGDGEQSRDYMYVSDTARAIAMLGTQDAAVGRTFNLGTGTEVTINDAVRIIAAEVGRTEIAPVHLEPRPGDVRQLLGSPALIRSLTGFRPEVSFEEGIERLVTSLRNSETSPETMLAQIQARNWAPEATAAFAESPR